MNEIPTNNDELNFSTLGFWRKIYLGVIWLLAVLIFLGGCVWLFIPEIMAEPLGFSINYLIGLMFLSIIYASWVHHAVVKRKANHILALVFIQIIPLMNPVTAIIFYCIYRISKKEVVY